MQLPCQRSHSRVIANPLKSQHLGPSREWHHKVLVPPPCQSGKLKPKAGKGILELEAKGWKMEAGGHARRGKADPEASGEAPSFGLPLFEPAYRSLPAASRAGAGRFRFSAAWVARRLGPLAPSKVEGIPQSGRGERFESLTLSLVRLATRLCVLAELPRCSRGEGGNHASINICETILDCQLTNHQRSTSLLQDCRIGSELGHSPPDVLHGF